MALHVARSQGNPAGTFTVPIPSPIEDKLSRRWRQYESSIGAHEFFCVEAMGRNGGRAAYMSQDYQRVSSRLCYR